MTRVLSGAALIALAIAVVWTDNRLMSEAAAFVLLFAATHELIGLFQAGGIPVAWWPTVLVSLLTLATYSGILAVNVPQLTTDTVLLAGVLVIALVVMRAWRGGVGALTTVGASLFPALYLALPIGAMIAILEQQGAQALSLLILTVIISDISQYYTGRLAGRHLLAPAISPKKTVEGAVGGLLFGTAAFAIIGAWWLPGAPVGLRIGIGFGLVAAGIAGDLFESMLKRSAGVKDSSSIIPGHGGVLDRIDALLFATAFFYLVGHFIAV